MLVDECVFCAQACIPHDLVKDCDLLIVFDSILIVLMIDLQVTELTLHSLVYLRQIKDILCCVLDHISGQRSLFPEVVMLSHYHSNLLLFSVSHVNVVLEQVCQGNVVVFTVN